MASDMRIGASPSPAPETRPQVDGPMWWFIVLSLCAVVLACGFSGAKSGVGGMAFQAGRSLMYAGLMAAALHVILKRTRVGSRPWAGFLLLAMSWLMASAIAVDRAQRQVRLAQDGYAEVLDEVISSVTASGPVDTSALTRPSKAKGNEAVLEMLVKGVVKRGVDLRLEREAELKKLGVERLLDGQRIKQDKSMAETRAMVSDTLRVLATYKQKHLAVLEDMQRQIETAPVDDEFRRGLLLQVPRIVQNSRDDMVRSAERDREIMEMMSQIAEMLGASRTRWQMQGDQLLFSRQSDLDEYKRRMKALEHLQAMQQVKVDERLRKARDAADSLR